MPWYKIDGLWVHICFGRRSKVDAPKPCVVCAGFSAFLCDWKIAKGKTCDRPLCIDHAYEVGPNKHLCSLHQAAYQEWKATRGARTDAAFTPIKTSEAKH